MKPSRRCSTQRAVDANTRLMLFLFRSVRLHVAVCILGATIPAARSGQAAVLPGLVNVRDHGAVADGRTLDTAALNAAIVACAGAGGGQVHFPPGRYLSGTLHLRSGVTLHLDSGARLIGTTNLAEYSQPNVPDVLPEARWGKWHRALILAENAEDLGIGGPGIIDGNRVFDPTGEERMRGPHTIVLVNCRRFTLRDVTIIDSANYALFAQVSDCMDIRQVTFIGGWDGVHWRGAPQRWCLDVRITGCRFYTGDDAIAGRYWDNTVISDCIINSSCNGIRLIGPATGLIVDRCLFYGPGEEPHRTSREQRRTNMLSGIILQPGAWDATQGPLDDVLLSNNTMRNVASPVTLWIKPGNTVGRVTVAGLTATGVYRSALSVESWADTPVTNVVLRNLSVEWAGGGTAAQAKQPVRGPGVDARPLPAWGIYARHVETLTVEDARLSLATPDLRPVIFAEKVGRLVLDHARFPRLDGVEQPVATDEVKSLTVVPP
ncbi:MAG: glycosyl hydrolase family 28-related protein [Verrucomicrobiota bacterium]|nr:glycosyl hydrolase family 28-related protein [Verrucomicrobiota bacterium]HOA61282.1 glycosyl hydrolase family 28-related protein [Verrucomicrobiota bacterium]HOU88428.1 glycosyl hydrolase family 28-related protein [Verrucomicrobiota bacterium]